MIAGVSVGRCEGRGVVTVSRETMFRSVVKRLGPSVLALAFNLGGMLAGTLLVSYLGVFSVTPWALLLFPGVLSVRGAIGGLFSGHLSTALHLGTVRASYTKNTRQFYRLVSAINTLTFWSSIILGLATSLFGVITLGLTFSDALTILAVNIATMGISLVLLSPLTLGISILSFKRGMDPDVIVYPVISTVADVIVTLCYIGVLTSFVSSQGGAVVIGLFDLVFLCATLYVLNKNYSEPVFVKTVKEFLLTIILVAFIVNVTGSFLDKISQIVRGNSKVYVVYPALIDTVGDVGSIVGSTATTKLALGTMERSFASIKRHLSEIGSAWMASLLMFSIYAVTSSIMYGVATLNEVGGFMIQLFITNGLAVSFIVVISFAVAIYTQKRGWDPDNFVIPIESSLADGITTISLWIALSLAI
jgi:mgtE-like transporter